jgi:hypothetical protein
VNTITVENSLAAHFKQSAGPSLPGIEWALRISGEFNQVVLVRTLSHSQLPTPEEKRALAGKAVQFLKAKLEQGWTPTPGILQLDA